MRAAMRTIAALALLHEAKTLVWPVALGRPLAHIPPLLHSARLFPPNGGCARRRVQPVIRLQATNTPTESPTMARLDAHAPAVLLLCCAIAAVCALDRVVMSVAILPMSLEFDYTDSIKGLIAAGFSLGYGLALLPAGLAASSGSPKTVLLTGLTLWSLAQAATPTAAAVGVPSLLAARAVMGAGEASATPSLQAIAAQFVPESLRSRFWGVLTASLSLGTITAYLVTPALIDSGGWAFVFTACGGLGLVIATAWAAFGASEPAAPRGLPTAALPTVVPVDNDAAMPVAGTTANERDSADSARGEGGAILASISASASSAPLGTTLLCSRSESGSRSERLHLSSQARRRGLVLRGVRCPGNRLSARARCGPSASRTRRATSSSTSASRGCPPTSTISSASLTCALRLVRPREASSTCRLVDGGRLLIVAIPFRRRCHRLHRLRPRLRRARRRWYEPHARQEDDADDCDGRARARNARPVGTRLGHTRPHSR